MMQRYRTADSAVLTNDDAVRFFTKDQIGENRKLTPEGYLLCEGVPIARTGTMKYGPDDTPVQVGDDGFAYIARDDSDLFDPDTIASFNGKAFTDEHPPEREVTLRTWGTYSKGVVMNARRGEGEWEDCIVADILVTDQQVIAAINDPANPKREVSAGYEADYMQDEPGQGRQVNIRGNHVALVRRGRCGPRCAINDHSPEKEPTMGTKTKTKRAALLPKVRQMLAKMTADAEAALEAMGLENGSGDPDAEGEEPDGDEGGTHVHVHMHGAGGEKAAAAGTDDEVDPNANPDDAGNKDPDARLAACEAAINKIMQMLQQLMGQGGGGDEGGAPTGDAEGLEPGDEDENRMLEDKKKTNDKAGKGKTNDSAALANSYAQVLGMAEILVPGIKAPVFDKALDRAKTVDNMCAVRRKALGLAYATADGVALINEVHGVAADATIDLDKLNCTDTAVLFKAAVGAKKLVNNAKVADGDSTARQTKPVEEKPLGVRGPKSIAELNELNKKYYSTHRV